MIQRKRTGAPEKTVRPEEALPALRDVLENHRLEMEEGATADDLAGWVREEAPDFDWKAYGFQEFSEFLALRLVEGGEKLLLDLTGGGLARLGHPLAFGGEEAAPDTAVQNTITSGANHPTLPGVGIASSA